MQYNLQHRERGNKKIFETMANENLREITRQLQFHVAEGTQFSIWY